MNAKLRAASLLLGALLAACAGNPTSPTPTGSSPPAPSPRPSPSPAGPPSITWTPEAGNGAALRDPAGAGGLGRVTQVGDGFLAVGTDTHGTTIWLRAGAGTWTRLDTDRFALADLVGLASTSLGMVASGTEESGTYGATFPTIWSSADGTAWSTPVLAGDEYRNITPVVELAGRLVALVGGNGAPTDLVSSTDGQAWRRVPALGLPATLLLGLVVAGSRLVAVGQTDMAAAWYSDDGGGSWRAATVPPGGTESTMTSVAAGRDGLIAVGSVAGASDAAIPAVWYSTDGTAWALAARGAGPGGLAAVAHGDDGWVAVGSNDIAGGQDLPDTAQRLGLTAVSGDGRDWVFLAPEKDAEFTSVTATAGGWMAAGRRHASALLWTSGAATARFVGGWPAVTPLACPPVSGRIDLASLLLIPVEQRLACLGPTEVTFRAWVVPQGGRGGTCGGSPTWLTCRLNVPADQVAAHEALTGPTLGVIPRPGAIMPASWNGLLPAGGWLQVTGHFDDPAASTCADATFGDVDTPARLVSWCRSQFVATWLGSPTPSVTEGGWPVAGATDPVFGRDGTVYAIVRTPDETPQAIVALDAGGHAMPGWPFRLPAPVSEVGLAAGRDGSLYATICQPSAAECGLHHLTADGRVTRGWPLPLEGMTGCSAPLVGPDGTVYATCAARADGPDPSTGLTVAADPVSGVRTGWPVHYGGDALAIAPDGTLYVNAWQSTWAGDAPMTVATFAPDGTLRSGWPRSWPADAFVRLAPDGTLYAWWYEDLQEGAGGFMAKRTFYAAIGTDGRTLPGWPLSSIGKASSPAFGADGTLYYDADRGDVYARDRKGAVRPGWPVRGVGGSDLAVSPPHVSPDGSILALDHSGATWLSPGGRALAAWGPGRSGSLTSCLGATPCAMRVDDPPVFAPDGTVYVLVWVADAESGNRSAEIVALDRHGDVKPGWPRSVPGLDLAGPEGAWLRVGPDGRVYVVGSKGLYALLPDGTLAR